MHPEVISISLLIILNLGKTSKESKTTRKVWSISRGYVTLSLETSERISDHIGLHKKPKGQEWEDYLAGLIDGSSSIEKDKLSLRLEDKSLLYYIKREIGFGSVSSKSITITNREGILKVFKQVNGKIRTEKKLNEIINTSEKYSIENMKLNIDSSYNGNYWLAGIIDSVGEINNEGLKLESASYEIQEVIREWNKKKLIDYLDKHHLQSSKYVNYIKLRKSYRLKGLVKR